MAKKSTIFLKISQSKNTPGALRFWGVFVLILITGLTLYFIKYRIDTKLDETVDEYKNEVELLRKKSGDIAKEVDTLESLFNTVEKKKRRLDKKVTILNKSTQKKSNSDSLYYASVDTTSLDFLLPYSESLAVFIEEYAKSIDKQGNHFVSIPVIPPIPINKPFTKERGFGKYKDPFTGRKTPHNGLDFAAPVGTAIIATADGSVRSVEEHRFWGKRVIVGHKSGFKTYYAHLGTIDVSVGKKVKKGQIIGSVGESGLTTGPHVHYEVHYKGKAIDPAEFLIEKELPQ